MLLAAAAGSVVGLALGIPAIPATALAAVVFAGVAFATRAVPEEIGQAFGVGRAS